MTIDIGKEAVDCGLWYLAEYENGKFKINRDPKEFTSVEDYLKKQSRFANFDAHDFERCHRRARCHLEPHPQRLEQVRYN